MANTPQQVFEGSISVKGLIYRSDNVIDGVITAAPVNGTSGTLAGIAGPGSKLTRTDVPTLYINTNTQASPTWTVVGTQT